MSSSSKTLAHLSVDAGLGVDVIVLDGAFSTIASASSASLSKGFAPGIYTIRWSAGDAAAQQTIRLREGDNLKLEKTGLIPGAAASEDTDLASRQLGVLIREVGERHQTVRLVVFVCANDVRTTSDVGKDVQLRPLGAASKMEVRSPRTKCDSEDGWSALHFDCEPGLYLLRYSNSERKRVEQTVFLPEGRTTIAWLRYGAAYTTEGKLAQGQLRVRRGIDSTRTRIISIAPDERANVLSDRFLLAGSVLTDLGARKGALSEALVQGLQSVHDPFIRLYAAAVLLTRPLSPEESWEEAADEPLALPWQNAFQSVGLLEEEIMNSREWPDAICARWRLNLADPNLVADYSQVLSAPPMLESAWRWASAWSVRHPGVLDANRSTAIAAVTMGQERTTPWLTWSARNTRAQPSANADRSSSELVELGTRTIAELSAEVDVRGKRRGIANTVSQDTRDLVRMAGFVGSTDKWVESSGALLSRLAGATGLPASELVGKANNALEEIRQLSSFETGVESDDPNKGAFGGVASANGFTVELVEFRQSNSPDFLALEFEVRGGLDAPIDGPVAFVLHPTFSPSRVTVGAIRNIARYTAFAWGSFTLGVEAPGGTRLELDLSEDARLPTWFRSR